MESASQNVSLSQRAPVSKKTLWTGRIISALVVFFLAFDCIIKFIKPAPQPVADAFAKLGWPVSHSAGLHDSVCYPAYFHAGRDSADRLSRRRRRHPPARGRSALQPRLVSRLFRRAALAWALPARWPAARTRSSGKSDVVRQSIHNNQPTKRKDTYHANKTYT